MPSYRLGLGRLKLPKPWKNRIKFTEYLRDDFERRKALAYKRIDNDGFGFWTVFTAGGGFLTGAYDIYAVNTIVPMLGIVYWGGSDGRMSPTEELSINLATLIGALIGQVTMGVLGDRYGRKKMYGVLLVIMIVTSVALSQCSRGAANSINILGWVISWRLLMGAAIGGDYALSAVITSEFAPRKHRAAMLASVFYAQATGQLIASIVAVVTIASFRHSVMRDMDFAECSREASCFKAVDRTWRWIVGFGAIPPAFAVVLRFYIPESPRYLLEVENNPLGFDAADYMGNRHDSIISNQGRSDIAAPRIEGGMVQEGLSMQDAPEIKNTVEVQLRNLRPSVGLAVPIDDASPGGSTTASVGSSRSRRDNEGSFQEPNEHSSTREQGRGPAWHEAQMEQRRRIAEEGEMLAGHPPDLQPLRSYGPPADVVPTRLDRRIESVHKPGKESWAKFWRGLRIFLFSDHRWDLDRLWLCLQFRDEHFFDGSWTDLAGTALTWGLLDLSYYMLLINSPKLVSKIWDGDGQTASATYSALLQYAWRAIISTSMGAIIGGGIFIAMARFRYNLQLYGFVILSALFVAVGVTFITLLDTKYFAAIIVLYCFSNLFFDLGPNTSTYIIPAEVFPTRYRCTCHGISAGAGKLGSIVAQIFLAKVKIGHPPKGVNDPHSKWLGWALIINAFTLLLGAYTTKIWVPNPCDINGQSRSLEDLGQGKQKRRQMEHMEAEERRRGEGNGN